LAIKSKDSEFFPELLSRIQEEGKKYNDLLAQMLKSSPEISKNAINEALERTTDIQALVMDEINRY
jgi:hypothetical protein